MAEVRHAIDPVSGKKVEIRNDLVRRLRGEYANGPTMPNGEPEFGWRKFGEPSPIHLEAAEQIERLRILLLTANRYVEGYAENENNHPQARDCARDLSRQIKEAT